MIKVDYTTVLSTDGFMESLTMDINIPLYQEKLGIQISFAR